MKIAIIGAGHAGVEAAATVAAGGATVDLFSNEAMLPYFRPRLIAVACGQAEPDAITMRPAAWYEQKGVRLHLETPVVVFEPDSRRIACKAIDDIYDVVILACGSLPILPRIGGLADGMPVFSLWSMRDALALRDRITAGVRVLVIGGGVLGVEAALRAVEAGAKPVIVERLPRLLSTALGATAADVLLEQTVAAGVDVRCGRSVQSLRREATGALTAVLDDGATIETDCVICSVGATPNRTLPQASGIDTDRGVLVDQMLQTRWPGVFVAGDLAQRRDGRNRCSVREAALQGKTAGANALAFATNGDLQPYVPPKPLVTLKVGAVEAYALGEVDDTADDAEVRLDDGSVRRICRLLVRHGDAVVGVQMVGSREGFEAASEKWSET